MVVLVIARSFSFLGWWFSWVITGGFRRFFHCWGNTGCSFRGYHWITHHNLSTRTPEELTGSIWCWRGSRCSKMFKPWPPPGLGIEIQFRSLMRWGLRLIIQRTRCPACFQLRGLDGVRGMASYTQWSMDWGWGRRWKCSNLPPS